MRYTFLLFALLGLAACNDPNAPDFIKSAGSTQTVERTVPSAIHRLLVEDDIEVELVQGLEHIEVTAPRNELPKVHTDYADGLLTIRNRNSFQWVRAYRSIRVRVPLDSLTDLEQRGFGYIHSTDTLRAASLHIAVYGAADLRLNASTQALALDLNGQGKLMLAGRTSYTYAALRKYAQLDAYDLQTRTADIEQDGAGDARITVSDSVHIRQKGPGCLVLDGRPRIGTDPGMQPCIRYR